MSTSRRILTPVAGLFAAIALTTVVSGQQAGPQPAVPKPAPALTDLDAFMSKVLEKRNENWRTLHDYILSERESFEVTGPADIPLHGLHREFHWFIRDGYLVRSPVKSNGVTLPADERKRYEDKWLEEEKKREKDPKEEDDPRKVELSMSVSGDVEFSGLAGPGAEPRFISEAYFMKFKFEPGNYYFAGREQLEGREVLKIEYLPSKLFNDDKDNKSGAKTGAGAKAGSQPDAKAEAKAEVKAEVKAEGTADTKRGSDKPGRKRDRSGEGPDEDERIERAMNKTSTVTMWIDPQEYQIVRFTFDNLDWGFLPGRQVARIDEGRASMTMGRVFEGIWLPKDVTMKGAVTFAAGTLRFKYGREFYDYRRGEVSAKIRGYVAKEPQS